MIHIDLIIFNIFEIEFYSSGIDSHNGGMKLHKDIGMKSNYGGMKSHNNMG